MEPTTALERPDRVARATDRPPTASTDRSVTVFGRKLAVVAPSISDPRMHIAAVIFSLHILGQTVLDFDVSIAQLAFSLGTALVIGLVVGVVRDRVIAWPASSVLAANGVAFVLRVPGTQHGDWWSTRGWWLFAGTAALALATKYTIRWQGRHIFNPSNIALVVVFLAVGSDRADPLPFWWGPFGPGVAAAYAVILVGGITLAWRLRNGATMLAFWVSWTAGIALVSARGHAMAAPWHLGPIGGRDYWWQLATSPEVLVFMFFMITDPRTSPSSNRNRWWFGATIGSVAAVLAATQSTEFGTKVALLSGLVVACGLRPIVNALSPRLEVRSPSGRPALTVPTRVGAVLVAGVLLVTTAAVAPNSAASRAPAVALTADAPTVDAVAERPTVTAGPGGPTISVNPSDRVAAQLDQDTVESIGRDVVADLEIVEMAQRDGRPDLAASATAETTFEQLAAELALAPEERRVEHHEIEDITISIARRVGQGAPAIMVTIRGTVSVGTATAPPTTPEPLHRTFEVKQRDGHYVIVTDDIPPGFDPP